MTARAIISPEGIDRGQGGKGETVWVMVMGGRKGVEWRVRGRASVLGKGERERE